MNKLCPEYQEYDGSDKGEDQEERRLFELFFAHARLETHAPPSALRWMQSSFTSVASLFKILSICPS